MKWKNWNLARNVLNDPMSIRSQPHRAICKVMALSEFITFTYRFDSQNLVRIVQQIPVL